ncbi:MarR family winged helix-turn-helix transcriptional regulator [Aquicoccus sp. SU-CL01552]|uniref:MarR family winged helix-turn-helix transcriptional regulator n=1 Tax=Aquicoccus sp. SU-CL01552 TaxID=3127656 RepID=UPI00310BB2C5
MSTKNKLDAIFTSDLRHLMLVSYIVLGNNAVTNRYIEHRYQMPVHAWSTLFAIVMFPGIRAKEIKHLFPRPQNTISRAVSLLEARGLVKHQTSPTDGREKRLFATPAGEDLLAEIRAVSVQRQEELFAPLTDKERETFFALARKIANGSELLASGAMPAKQAPGKEPNRP